MENDNAMNSFIAAIPEEVILEMKFSLKEDKFKWWTETTQYCEEIGFCSVDVMGHLTKDNFTIHSMKNGTFSYNGYEYNAKIVKTPAGNLGIELIDKRTVFVDTKFIKNVRSGKVTSVEDLYDTTVL